MTLLTLDDILDKLWKCLDNEKSVKAITETFSESHSDAEKFFLAYQNLQLFNLLPHTKDSVGMMSKKSEKMSIELRNAGNRVFAKNQPNLREALKLYTESIASAPYPVEENSHSEHLGIALANRSAVFFAMKKYDLCLQDMEQAVKCNYPSKLMHKLCERMGKCYMHTGKSQEATACFQDVIGTISKENSIPEESLKSIIKRLESLKIEAEIVPESELSKEIFPIVPNIPKISHKHHTTVPSFSDCVNINQSADMGGRFIQATRDIALGDVLVVEKPYSSVLLPENFYTHCYQCLQRCEGLIPCKDCSKVMFCSERCRENAQPYHCFECPILSSLLNLNMGLNWLLALRVLLVATARSNGLQKLQENIKNLELNHCDEDLTGLEANKKFQSTDNQYSIIHYLVQNSGYRSYKSVYKLATMAACIMSCLDTDTDFFGKDNENNDSQLFAGSLLLQYLLSLSCNNYSVADLVLSTTGEKQLTTETIGCAVYGFSSFFNHSCDPQVVRSYHAGDVMAITASRPIRKGEQIFCDYGYSFSQMELQERRNSLQSEYFFLCNCEACGEDWPTSSILELVDPTFLCSQCASPLVQDDVSRDLEVCGVCQQKSKMSALRGEYEKVSNNICDIKLRLLDGIRQDFSRQLANSLAILHKLVERPAQIIIVAQDALRHNMMLLGNFYNI